MNVFSTTFATTNDVEIMMEDPPQCVVDYPVLFPAIFANLDDAIRELRDEMEDKVTSLLEEGAEVEWTVSGHVSRQTQVRATCSGEDVAIGYVIEIELR